MKEKKAAAVKGSASQVLIKYQKNVDIETHRKNANLSEDYRFIPGYYRILSNDPDEPAYARADYLEFIPGKPVEGTTGRKAKPVSETAAFIKKAKLKAEPKKNGRKLGVVVDGKRVEVGD